MRTNEGKIAWSGRLIAVQPRIRLTRSFDQRHHNYPGYVLRIKGTCGSDIGEFLVAVGKGAHGKHRFCVEVELAGVSVPITDERTETAGFYRTSGIRVEMRPEVSESDGPPTLGVPPDLSVYRERGHQRLDAQTYEAKCTTCIWGCRMPVEIITDPWNPSKKRYRFETFCYGPKSCPLYKAGATRKVPGRGGMTWEEEDWVDEEATAHRGPDD
jgi:hypothetical protein